MHELRLTRSAVGDLGLPAASYGLSAEDLVDEDPFVAKFLELRRDSATGQEPTLNVKPTTYNVHAGDRRGVTWHDKHNNIVWLCAVTWHDYKDIERRAARGTLLPAAVDYADVDQVAAGRRERPFIEAAIDDATALRLAAEATPGQVVRRLLADEVEVSLLVETLGPELSPADYWLVVHHPRLRRRPVGSIGDGVELALDDAVTVLVLEDAADDDLQLVAQAPSALGELLPGRDHVWAWRRP